MKHSEWSPYIAQACLFLSSSTDHILYHRISSLPPNTNRHSPIPKMPQPGKKQDSFLKRCKPYIAIISLQFGYAGMNIITKVSLDRGMSHYVLVVYRHAFATVAIAPFALILERWDPLICRWSIIKHIEFEAVSYMTLLWQENKTQDDLEHFHANICSCSPWVIIS